MTPKATYLFKLKNSWLTSAPSFLTSTNIYQQTIDCQHTNILDHNITTYHTLSYHQTHILNLSQQKKTMKRFQDHSEFILLNITLLPRQNHQYHTSKSLHTQTMTMYLTLLFMLSLP